MYRRSSFEVLIIFMGIMLTVHSGCSTTGGEIQPEGPSVVTVEQSESGFQLLVNGEPFYVKGAGGDERLETLASFGGNSIRTWGADNAGEILDRAHEHGIMVMMGLWVRHERHGFDYNNEVAVQEQLEGFRAIVKEHKDHPALLMWAVGNEMELQATNMKVWDAVDDIGAMIKEEDPNHPTITVLAEVNEGKMQEILTRVSSIDILGVNSYGGLGSLPDRIRRFGWNKPYMVTEWGVNGHWEVGRTDWGAPVEPNSTVKAATYQSRYEDVIEADGERCLGSYVFLWGDKQERTPTWYGLFLDTGEKTPMADAMAKAWSGAWPENRAPFIEQIYLQDQRPGSSVRVNAGTVLTGKVVASDPEEDPLDHQWYILRESSSNASGGDQENRPEEMTGLIISAEDTGELYFTAPDQPGAYRLFVNILDGNGNAGTANVPFFVESVD
jgi:hypothetical protein